MHTYTAAAPRRNALVAPLPQTGMRAPIPANIASELRPDAREIWRRTRRAPETCNALAQAWAGYGAER